MAAKVKASSTVKRAASQGKTKRAVKKKLASTAAASAGKKEKPSTVKKTPTPPAPRKTSKTAPSRKSTKPSSTETAKRTAAKKAPKLAAAKRKPTAKKAATARTAKAPARKTARAVSKPTKMRSARTKAANGKTVIKKTDEQAIKEFRKLVNLTPDQLERWLGTSESKKVGFKDEGKGAPAGHESGRKILRILPKRRDRYTDEDVKHMRKVVGYVKRHLSQKPIGDITASNWRYSLMNWGHDPAR